MGRKKLEWNCLVYGYWGLRHKKWNFYSTVVRARAGEKVKSKVEEVICHRLFIIIALVIG